MKIIINERQYKEIFLSGKYDSLITEDIIPSKIKSGIVSLLSGISDEIGERLDDVKKVFKLSPNSTWDDLATAIQSLKTLNKGQIKSLLGVTDFGISNTIKQQLAKDEGLLIQIAAYKKALENKDITQINKSKTVLKSILPEDMLDEFVENVQSEAVSFTTKLMKQQKIVKEIEKLDLEKRQSWILNNQKEFNAAQFTEKDIINYFKNIITPDFSEFRTLLQDWNKSGRMKPFEMFAQDKGYTLPKNLTTFLKKYGARSTNKLFELLSKLLSTAGANPMWLTLVIIAFSTGIYNVFTYIKGWISDETYDIEKEVSNFLSQDKVIVNGVNIAAINDNIITTMVTKVNDKLVKVDPPLRVIPDGPVYDMFIYDKGILKPYIKKENSVSPKLEDFGAWYKTQKEYSDLSNDDKKIISFRMKDKSYEAYLPEDKTNQESIEGTYDWDGKTYVKK